MEAPSIEVLLLRDLISDLLLHQAHSLTIRVAFDLLRELFEVLSLVEPDSLVVIVDIKLEQVVTSELIDLLFVLFDLVLDLHYLIIAPSIEPSPELLDLVHPSLMGGMCSFISIDLVIIDWHQVLQCSHLLR